MFPISSLSSSPAAELQAVNRTAEATAVNSATINPVGSALDAPPAASVQVDLSPVASFLLSVTNAQDQLAQVQGTQAQRADTVNAAVQNVVDSFNLLPTVDFDQGQPAETSLLNNLVNSLNQQVNDGVNTNTQAQNLSRLGVTLQPSLLSELSGGLSLEPELLRTAFNANDQQTTQTLQNTLNTFRQQATEFAERLSAAGSSQIAGLNPFQQPALTPADLATNTRLQLTDVQSTQQTSAPAVAQALTAAQANAEQTNAAQVAAAQQAANTPTDLRSNPALAAAIAAYNINDVAGTTGRAAQAAQSAIPRVGAVNAITPSRGIGNAP